MPRKKRKGYYISSEVVMVDEKTGEPIGRIRKSRIFVYAEGKGRIVKDGREVELKDGKWVYKAA